ncbi:MAG: YjgP/YjgQ family permease [Saprospiraceae bacterium]|nr:YjgP/YjgQ family permease [Saprospiraceae bacterium]
MFKKIDKLLINSFFPPFVVTFFIALFVFIMSFLWSYIDKIIGKGADLFMLTELIFYLSASLVPTCLPIAIMISSVMVLGNLAERYELTSMKSAGVPLLRVMAPLMLITGGIAVFSYLCSDKLIPVANLQFKTRLYDIKRNKPTLNLEEGVFNYDFKNFVMFIGKKENDNRSIHDVVIYDHNTYNKNTYPRIFAKEGEMFTTPDEKYFVMRLRNGTQYQEVIQNRDAKNSYPFMRVEFDEWTKVFDLGQFDINESDQRVYKSHHAMLSRRQLSKALDSLEIIVYNKEASIANLSVKSFPSINEKLRVQYKDLPKDKILEENLKAKYNKQEVDKDPPPKPVAKNKSRSQVEKVEEKLLEKRGTKPPTGHYQNIKQVNQDPKKSLEKIEERKNSQAKNAKPYAQTNLDSLSEANSLIQLFDKNDQGLLISKAKNTSKNVNSQLEASLRSLHRLKENRVKHIFELHTKFTLAVACVVFLFIGAPMGAIIRKGGFGFPILVAIVFFVLYIVLNMLFKKIAESLVVDPVLAAWMPILVIFPIGIFLTFRAMRDKKVVDFDLLIQKVISIFKRNKTSKAAS